MANGHTEMEFDIVCISCGDSPSYNVSDGKTDGPTKINAGTHLRTNYSCLKLRRGNMFADC